MDKIKEKAVVTVVGRDSVGILAKVSGACAKANANVIEVTQSVLNEFFCMIMIIDISAASMQIEELQELLSSEADNMSVHVMHENIFNAMHRI
ncbi:MAG: ACT domain-containing protein [Eubacterium sp.]|nr:ACT domain-containing protein [Eubacterium sp.]